MFAAAEARHNEFERRRQAALEDIGKSSPSTSAVRSVRPLPTARSVTATDLAVIEADIRRREANQFSQLYLLADGDPVKAEMLADQIERYEIDAAERRQAILAPGFDNEAKPWLPSPAKEAVSLVKTLGLDAPLHSHAFGAVVAAIRRGYILGAHEVGELLAGRAKPRVVDPTPVASSTELFSHAVSAYLSHRSLAPRTAREVQKIKEEFLHLIGDKPLAELTRDDFVTFVAFRASRTVGGRDRHSVARPASIDTVKKVLTLLRAAIGHAIKHKDFVFTGPNPALNIDVGTYTKEVDKRVMPDKRPFKVGELNKVLQHPWFTGCAGTGSAKRHRPGIVRLNGSEYWAPVLAIYTGCRVSELGGLRLAEIALDGPHPHLAIRDNNYRGTKGGYARDVPILDALRQLGFYDYVERVRADGADRLFPDWTPPVSARGDEEAWYNSRVIKAFNRTVIPATLGAGMNVGARRDVTFHSFRGAFKTLLQSSRYGLHPNLINEVIGHAKSDLDQRYVGPIPIEETYPAVRGCDYVGLIVPPAP